MWRWDQGRLLYFQYDVLKEIAKVLVKFDNADISACEQLFRNTLVSETGMPFLPVSYTIKRNYSRVFQCSFLASFLGNRIVVTDICRDLANSDGKIKSVDDYLFNYVSKFRFPFPAFDNYNSAEQRVYPFCAIIKFLIARQEMDIEAKASLDDIFTYIIGNNCTGFEDIDYFKALKPVEYRYTDTERRQLREMVIFVSQLSVLKVYGGYLYLDEINENAKAEMLSQFLKPENRFPKAERIEEFLEMTSITKKIIIPTFEVFTADPADVEFIEGNKKRVEHFRVERSGLLRKYYRQVNPTPVCCACGAAMSTRYPWTDYMLDIHHLLPLSSSVAISSHGTSLADIVGLCPSCHRAVHMYYRKWLKANEQSDFKTKQEAHDVFLQATKEIA
ncbi:MAG: HNH endonuclease [Ruminococcaceae bacterium]|nr:HNH endonuclease [Oscillospiraceae bacterium]